MDKKPFSADTMDRVISGETGLKLHVQNDIYGNYDLYPAVDLNGTVDKYVHSSNPIFSGEVHGHLPRHSEARG